MDLYKIESTYRNAITVEQIYLIEISKNVS